MKKSFILLCLSTLISCTKCVLPIEEDSENEKQLLQFTEINLNETSMCNYMYYHKFEKKYLYVINTKKEYDSLFQDYNETLPTIDFSHQTFFIVWDNYPCVMEKSIDFVEQLNKTYSVDISVRYGLCCSITPWCVAFYSNRKIADDSTIVLNIKYWNREINEQD